MYSPHSVSMLLRKHISGQANVSAQLAEITGKPESEMKELLSKMDAEIMQVDADYPTHDERYAAKASIVTKYDKLIVEG